MTAQGIDGRFDGIEHGSIYGWAVRCRTLGLVATIDVLIDETPVATVVADRFRPDLEQAGIRGGYAGFSVDVPALYRDGKPHIVEVRHRGADRPLAHSPHVFKFADPSGAAERRREAWTLAHLVLQDGTQVAGFAERLAQARKVAIVSTYHDAGRFLSYHEALFEALSERGFVTVVVHASGGSDGRVAAPRAPDCYTIVKHNVGYDFGSWAVAVHRLQPHLGAIDEVLLLNDSVIPVEAGGIGRMIDRARSSGADVVGLTDSYEHIYHLQSYFLWLGADALRSPAFRGFMAAYSFSSVKKVVIAEGELALTKRFLDAGLSVRALCEYDEVAACWLRTVDAITAEIDDLPAPARDASEDYRRTLTRHLGTITGDLVAGRPVNPTHYFWDVLIERFGFPFLKREFVLTNPSNVPTYFRLGRVLHPHAGARAAIKEIRRIYGGHLLPMFAPQPEMSVPFPAHVPARSGRAPHLTLVSRSD